jgi:FkbM family methyltransferase
MIVERHGWFVPEYDNVCLDIVLSECADMYVMLKYCQQKRTAIQAGGNVGIWPTKMALEFQRVITAEPDNLNYSALVKNVSKLPNIDFKNCAFGKEPGTGSIDDIIPGNIGAYQIKAGADFSIITIDSLGVEDCDLLQLDVEGFEQFALEGAVNTIKKSWPVIGLELKGLGERYGCPDQLTHDWLQKLGYRFVEKIHNDSIFVKES